MVLISAGRRRKGKIFDRSGEWALTLGDIVSNKPTIEWQNLTASSLFSS
jgi:hypothetical protein